MMLRIAREVAWLRLGSCTDQVISAAAATPDKRDQGQAGELAQAPRQRLADRGRQMADQGNDTFDRWHAHPKALRLLQGFDQPVQCFGR